MVDFTLAQIGETSGGATSPRRGVAEPSAVGALMDFASEAGSTIFEAFTENREEAAEAKAETQANKLVSNFAKQQMQIADAVDRGDFSSQRARMTMRNNLIRAITDNPNLTDSLRETHKQIVGTAGMGKVAAEGTEVEQAFFSTQRKAMDDGWVSPDMTADEAREATIAYQSFQLRKQEQQAKQDAANLAKAQVQLGTARITQETAALNLQNTREEREARAAVTGMADSYSVRLRNKFNMWQRQVEGGQLAPEEAARLMDEEWLVIQNTVQEAGRAADTTYLTNVVAPMQRLYEVKRGYITGETPKEVMEAQAENAIAQQTQLLLADERTARVIATSRLVGQGGALALRQPLTNIALDLTEKNSGTGRPGDVTDTGDPERAEGVTQYLDITKNAVRKANTDSLVGGPGSQQELETNINQILRSVGAYGAAVDSPQEFNPVANFLASDDYGAYVESFGTGIDKERAGNARAILQEQYDAVVRPLVAEEWRNAEQLTMEVFDPARPETAGATEAVSGAIRPFFDGSGVRFIPTNESQVNPRIRQKMNDLNKRVAPVVNRLVRMGAHLEGHRNYEQVYQANYAELFGDVGTGASGEERDE